MIVLTTLSVISILLLRISYTDWLKKIVEVPITLYATGFITAAYMFSQRYYEFFFFSLFFILAWAIAKPYFENKKLIGAGDISVLSFVIPATWFVNAYMLPLFLLLFGVISFILYRKELFNKNEKPMIPMITIAFLLSWIILTIGKLV